MLNYSNYTGLEGKAGSGRDFRYGKYRDIWHYSISTNEGLPSKVLRDATFISIAVTSKLFNPEKMKPLLELLLTSYLSKGAPTNVLEGKKAKSSIFPHLNLSPPPDALTLTSIKMSFLSAIHHDPA
jgi:hypothetical protein